VKKLQIKRREAVELIQSEGFQLEFVNGGGTGSLESTSQEEVVTEVTVGSGFYNAHLFDNYQNFNLHPALFYAIEVVRKPNPEIYTCHGGGFIASGAIEAAKAPQESPIRFKHLKDSIEIGDPIFLRHAKSGELCERFQKLYVLDEKSQFEIATYRGSNCTFG